MSSTQPDFKVKSNMDAQKDFANAIDKERTVCIATRKMSTVKQKAMIVSMNWYQMQAHMLSAFMSYMNELDDMLCVLQADYANKMEHQLTEYDKIGYAEKQFSVLTSPLQQQRTKVKKIQKEFKSVQKVGGSYYPQGLVDRLAKQREKEKEMVVEFQEEQAKHDKNKQAIIHDAMERQYRIFDEYHQNCLKIHRAKGTLLVVFYGDDRSTFQSPQNLDDMEKIEEYCNSILEELTNTVNVPLSNKLLQSGPRKYKPPKKHNVYTSTPSSEEKLLRRQSEQLQRSSSAPAEETPTLVEKQKTELRSHSEKIKTPSAPQLPSPRHDTVSIKSISETSQSSIDNSLDEEHQDQLYLNVTSDSIKTDSSPNSSNLADDQENYLTVINSVSPIEQIKLNASLAEHTKNVPINLSSAADYDPDVYDEIVYDATDHVVRKPAIIPEADPGEENEDIYDELVGIN